MQLSYLDVVMVDRGMAYTILNYEVIANNGAACIVMHNIVMGIMVKS